MSAAVATRSQQRNNLTPSRTMATGSASDKKSLKHDDSARKASPAKQTAESRRKSPNPDPKDKSTDGGNAAKPLAPPPKPTPAVNETPDYFSGLHNNTASFALEPNPFEQQFGGSGETPGKSLLPPVAALTSPASLLGGGPNSAGFSWANSLRAGPLSPAMLTGPAGGSDIFDAQFKGFPTPNESSLRTGLTPGGGGSMFPMTSPNPLFNNLAGGGATPGTLDFHRTAMSAAASSRAKEATSIPSSFDALGLPASREQAAASAAATAAPAQRKTGINELFAHGDANDAANGLFMLAQAKPETRSGVDSNAANTGAPKRSHSESEGQEDGSEGDKSEAKPVTRSRGKKQPAKKVAAAAPTTRRKSESAAPKGPAAKKAKIAEDQFDEDDDDDMMDDDDEDMGMDDGSMPHKDTRKMTDEEKRKNFLERNRVAALKCRQRKKQWLANLQSKVELYSTENDALNAQVAQLRQEVMNLKTLLLAHKDCPVTQGQGLTSMNMAPLNDFSQHPYNLAMANRAPGVMSGQNVQRRFS